MNFLPIPALDGGHVMFLAIEKITGKKPTKEFSEKLNNFLKNDIHNDGFTPAEGKHAPFVQRTLDSMGIDDLYNMLNVDAPGLDI